MKLFLALLCLAAGTSARSVALGEEDDIVIVDGPLCPVDDPSHKEGPTLLNGTAHPFVKIQPGSTLTNIHSEGLSTLDWRFSTNLTESVMSFEAKFERFTGNATYAAHGYLDAHPLRPETLPSGNFTGAGFGSFAFTNFHLQANCTLYYNIIQNRITLSELHIYTLTFDSLSVDLGPDFVVAGKTPNWAELSANFKDNFNQDWASDKEGITQVIRGAFNGFTHYTITEFLEFLKGDVEC